MSMYKDYTENQLHNRFVYETDKGFITYNINGNICQTEELYVKPEFRRQGVARELRNYVATKGKELGCNIMLGSIVIGTQGTEVSCMALLNYGYKFSHTNGIMIFFKKEIGV